MYGHVRVGLNAFECVCVFVCELLMKNIFDGVNDDDVMYVCTCMRE